MRYNKTTPVVAAPIEAPATLSTAKCVSSDSDDDSWKNLPACHVPSAAAANECQSSDTDDDGVLVPHDLPLPMSPKERWFPRFFHHDPYSFEKNRVCYDNPPSVSGKCS